MSRKRMAQKMSQTYQELDLGPRVQHWLKLVYHGSRAKLIARDHDVSESTAKRWLSGERPTSDVLTVMARRWGWRFVSFVFEPAVGTPAMYAEMEAMDARLRRLEGERVAEDARVALAMARQDAELAGAAPCADRPLAEEAHPVEQRRAAGGGGR